MASAETRSSLAEPLIPRSDRSAEQPAQASEVPSTRPADAESAAPLPSQTGTLKILAVVLLVVALLVGAAALLSKSGVVQPSGPPPQCRKSAAMAVLRQEDTITNHPLHTADTSLLQLIIWGGKGNRAELVFDDSHVMNMQDRKWHVVQQKAGVVVKSLTQLPGLRNVWKSAPSQPGFQDASSQLPLSRWKQVMATDGSSSSMIMFGGDSMGDDDDNAAASEHDYLNDAWQLTLNDGKAQWQQLWNTGSDDEAPQPRRAAAGALFTLPNTTTKRLLIHGGRLEAGHILEDLWQATLGAGNVTWQQLWPPQNHGADNKKARGPAARKGQSAVAVHEHDPCMVIFGGRNGLGYFNDVWAFRLSTGEWEDWTPTDGNAPSPMGRDHFGAVYDAGHMYVYGGRGGSSYGKSHALDDLWQFTLASRTWTKLDAIGPAPLPRFLFSTDLFYPVLHQEQGPKQTWESDMALDTDLGWLGFDETTGSNPANTGQAFAKTNCDEASFPVEATDSAPKTTDLASKDAKSRSLNKQGPQSAEEGLLLGRDNKGPAGAIIVFGGESIKGCYLNDVWVLHLNSLLWQQLSKPVACQKRCRSIIEGRS